MEAVGLVVADWQHMSMRIILNFIILMYRCFLLQYSPSGWRRGLRRSRGFWWRSANYWCWHRQSGHNLSLYALILWPLENRSIFDLIHANPQKNFSRLQAVINVKEAWGCFVIKEINGFGVVTLAGEQAFKGRR